jgi:hypothetical protein
MHWPSLFVVLVYVSGYLFLMFSAICLVCGLFYLVELAEERTMITKRIIKGTIVFLLGVHALLWMYERFPFLPTAVGFLSHASYLLLLTNFPYIRPLSIPFVSSCAFFALDNVVWFFFFHDDPELFYRYRVAPAPAITSFYLLVVWLVPLAFFVCLSVNDAVLPNTGSEQLESRPIRTTTRLDPDDRKKNSRNLILVLMDTVTAALKRGMNAVSSSTASRGGDILSSAGNSRRY